MRMSARQIKKWRQTRQMGRSRFIWVRGVLGWGVPTAIFWSFLMAGTRADTSFIGYFVTGIVLFPVGGYFWGIWVWKNSECQYLSQRSRDAS
jgi:hypothetical protein